MDPVPDPLCLRKSGSTVIVLAKYDRYRCVAVDLSLSIVLLKMVLVRALQYQAALSAWGKQTCF
jgi:hypothetical protein